MNLTTQITEQVMKEAYLKFVTRDEMIKEVCMRTEIL
jgi:hypothetical protein